MTRSLIGAAILASVAVASCAPKSEDRTFATPDDAVRTLIDTVNGGDLEALVKLFGPEGRDLVSGSDPATGRRNQQVFLAAIGEQWRLEDRDANTKELIVGNEDWPFPIPLVRSDQGWRFDAPAGREEILARRIGRNELAVIDVCRAYVKAQRAYARTAHDENRAGLYAQRFGSEPGRQNGLYWPPTRHQPRSPLGDLVAGASDDGYDLGARKSPEPFHGYYFRILTAQGPAAPGGEMDYLRDSEMSGGFALIAWPAQYDASGVMTFIVNASGVVYEKDLGPETATAVAAIVRYDPDTSWRPVQNGSAVQP
ncbi:MAG TPA: DUF2950 domain-containing protein [Vicinamibacteria bacterium]|nr:DUF2950 domain-containing protein [Vicinamibacteria bacterium]